MSVDLRVPHRKPGLGELITTMRVAGSVPLTRNVAGVKRPSYRAWLATLDEAAAKAARKWGRTDIDCVSVRIQLCLFGPKDHHADLDSYVKPILDAMARHGVERIDHLELARERVHEIKQAGLFVEVRSLAGAATAPA